MALTAEQQAELAALEAENASLAMVAGQASTPATAGDPMAEASVGMSPAGATLPQGLAAVAKMTAPVAAVGAPVANAVAAAGKAIAPEGATEGIKDDYEKLPDWMWMPEFRTLSGPAAMAWGGTMAAGPEEAAKVMETQFPGVKARKDGRYVVFTSGDGKEYAWKPGFRPSDLLRAGAGMVAAAPIAMAAPAGVVGGALAGAAGAALNEGLQWASGGTFDREQIGYGALAGALVPAATAAKRAITGEGAAAAAAKAAAEAAGQTFEEGAATLGRASQGSGTAREAVRSMLDIDEEALAAAKNLGVGDLLSAKQVAQNPVARELLGSAEAGNAELREIADEGGRRLASAVRAKVAEWANQFQQGAVDPSLKNRLDAGMGALRAATKKAFTAAESKIPVEAEAVVDETLRHLRDKAASQRANFPPAQQLILSKLEQRPNYEGLKAIREGIQEGVATRAGEYKDISKAAAKLLDGKLADDLLSTAEMHGQGEMLKAGRALSSQENALKEGFSTLFGRLTKKALAASDGSIATKMDAATKAAIRGDASSLVKLYETMPPSFRAETVLKTVGQLIDDAGDLKPLVTLFDAIEANPQLRGILSTSLPTQARSGMASVAKIARVVARAAETPSYPARLKSALPNVKPGIKSAAYDKAFKASSGWLGKPLETDKVKVAAQFLIDESRSIVAAPSKDAGRNLFRRFMDALDVPQPERQKWFDAVRAAPSATPRRSEESE